ncbi:hypothetical protein BH10PSE2_BH10PSE2_10700 [soil metagenome]
MTRKTPTTLPPGAWTSIRDAYLAGESAVVICEQFNISLAALRRRARENGWRRSDVEYDDDCRSTPQLDLEAYAASLGLDGGDPADDDEPDDLTGPDFEDPTILAEMSLLRASKEVLAGHAVSALRWTRLYRELKAIGVARAKEKALAAETPETLETPVSPPPHDLSSPSEEGGGGGAARLPGRDCGGDALSPASYPTSRVSAGPPIPHDVGPSVSSAMTPPIPLAMRQAANGEENAPPSLPPMRRPKWNPVAALAIIDARIAREKREALETLETLETPVSESLAPSPSPAVEGDGEAKPRPADGVPASPPQPDRC